jgi:hypothetical protein
VPHFERYPLCIELDDLQRIASPIQVRQETVKRWFKNVRVRPGTS